MSNLKHRASPVLPKEVLDQLLAMSNDVVEVKTDKKVVRETLEQATQRVTVTPTSAIHRIPARAQCAGSLDDPANPHSSEEEE